MRTTRGLIGAVLFGALTASCASAPRPSLTGGGALPAPASFRMTSDGAADRLVAARLTAKGFAVAPQGSEAAYLVHCAYAVRPLKVGVDQPRGAPGAASKAVLAAPMKDGGWLRAKRQAYRLTIEIDDLRTGASLYRVSADMAAPIKAAAGAPPQLVNAALTVATG